MLDISLWEIVVVFVVILLVLGPKQLPHAAKIVGIWLGKMRRSLENIKQEIDREIDKKDDTPSISSSDNNKQDKNI